jgi:hypothetical protein
MHAHGSLPAIMSGTQCRCINLPHAQVLLLHQVLQTCDVLCVGITNKIAL